METKSSLQQLMQGETPVLIDFSAAWCGPCKLMAPVLSQVAQELVGKVKIIKVDVDRNQAFASQHQIMGVPTLILFQHGKPVWRQSGLMQAPDLIRILQPFLG